MEGKCHMINRNAYNKKECTDELGGAKYQNADGSYLNDSLQLNSNNKKVFITYESTRYRNVKIGSNGIAKMFIEGQELETEKRLPELYERREDCCGCGACYAICPLSDSNRPVDYETKLNYLPSCISMEPDDEGFLYPVIDASICTRCYKCLSVCSIKKKRREKI